MFWIVQSDLYTEYGYQDFLAALEKFEIDHIIIKPIPFTNRIVPADFDSMEQDFNDVEEPYIDDSQPIMVCGATALNRIAKARGWTPGTFLNDNFDFSIWKEGYGAENILNADSIVCSVKEATFEIGDDVFARPVDDSKAFTGMVQTRETFQKWQKQISAIVADDEFVLLNQDTQIIVSTAKNIMAEYRFFVVEGKVITGSLYKRGSVCLHDANIDQYIVDFTQRMVDKWQPAQAFVLDIAETSAGLKVIEINNLNSAGFYASDVTKIINAIENMSL